MRWDFEQTSHPALLLNSNPRAGRRRAEPSCLIQSTRTRVL
jgi:hypothetical protein